MNNTKNKAHVSIRWEECKGCGLCTLACPLDLLSLSKSFNSHGYHPSVYEGEGCTGCGSCFFSCPEPGAITVFKKWHLMTETGYCPNCDNDYKVYKRETHPDELFCSNCLESIKLSKVE